MDAIDAAMVGADEKATVRMRQFQVRIALTGRPAVLVVPADASDGELAELAGFLLTQALRETRAERAKGKGGGLVAVRSVLPKSLRS